MRLSSFKSTRERSAGSQNEGNIVKSKGLGLSIESALEWILAGANGSTWARRLKGLVTKKTHMDRSHRENPSHHASVQNTALVY